VATGTSSSAPPGANVRTFLFADMRGWTAFTGQVGDEVASETAARFADLVQSLVPSYDGELVELRGDEALCVFLSPRQGLRAAVAVQRLLRTPGDGEAAFPLPVGMGLDAGEALPVKGGYRGTALNVAARLCAAAQGGEILATDRLTGLAGTTPGIRCGAPRELRLKGIEAPVRTVRVEATEPMPPPPEPVRPSRRRRAPLRAVAPVMVVLALLLATVLVLARGGSDHTAVTGIRVRSPSVAIVDPADGRVVADVKLATDPESMTVGGGMVWVGGADQTITPLAPRERRALTPIPLGVDPKYVAYGNGSVWAFDGLKHLREVDAGHRYTVGPVRTLFHCVTHFPAPGEIACGAGGIDPVGDQLWVPDGELRSAFSKLDEFSMRTFRRVGVIANVGTGQILDADGTAWVWGGVGMGLDQVDIAGRRVIARTDLGVVASYTGGGMATGFGDGWVAAPASGTLFGVDAGQETISHRYKLTDGGLTCVATSPGSVWVGVNDGRLLRVNPFTGTHRSFVLADHPVAAAYADGLLWVAVSSE
jgi:class 3 adenylate cyclase